MKKFIKTGLLNHACRSRFPSTLVAKSTSEFHLAHTWSHAIHQAVLNISLWSIHLSSDLHWKNGRLWSGKIKSKLGGICRIRSASPIITMKSNLLLSREQNQYQTAIVTPPPWIKDSKSLVIGAVPKYYEYVLDTKAGQLISF